MRVLITGGAGLVGNALTRLFLKKGAKVLCVDNFSLGTRRHIEEFNKNSDFDFMELDVSVPDWHKKIRGQSFDLLAHLAANSDISLGNAHPEMDKRRTFETTFEALMVARDMKIPKFIFSSSSAVYGQNPPMPTPEFSPSLHPVSIYGAGKLASEAFISAFVENYGIDAWVFRFGNVVGEKLTHGVIYDFIGRLRKNPIELNVLGNGFQTKTYIDVEDCVLGIYLALEKSPAGSSHPDKFQIFNLSTEGSTSVRQIAEESCRVLNLKNCKINYEDSPVGWVGDVSKTSLDISKIKKCGWRPQMDSTAAVFKAIKDYALWSQSGT
jgi:UDP-glucose 4-epimerase